MRRCEGTETEKEVRTDMNKGRIVQVMGPVVDVLFEDGELPNIKDALEVDNGDKTCIMEVAQHLGNSEVRCLMLAASEGLHKDMEVRATGSGIKVPSPPQNTRRSTPCSFIICAQSFVSSALLVSAFGHNTTSHGILSFLSKASPISPGALRIEKFFSPTDPLSPSTKLAVRSAILLIQLSALLGAVLSQPSSKSFSIFL